MPKDKMLDEQMAQEPTPTNRDAYSQMWQEDDSDVDFEDKESRYGRMIDDRNELRERRKSDSALGSLFDRHSWLASMFLELKDNEDMDVFEWLEGFCNENGVSIQEVLDNPDARERLNNKLADQQKKAAENESASKAKDDNLQKSYEALQSAFPDKGEEEINDLWLGFWKIVESAQEGNVDESQWKSFAKSLTYDSDVETARNEGGMIARNDKIQNKVRKPSESEGLPPTLSQGSAMPTAPKRKSKESFLSGLNG